MAAVFSKHEKQVGTRLLKKGLTSNEVLTAIRDDLVALGFQVELGKQKEDKIQRPVFFGEGGQPTLKYEIDAYHPDRIGVKSLVGQTSLSSGMGSEEKGSGVFNKS